MSPYLGIFIGQSFYAAFLSFTWFSISKSFFSFTSFLKSPPSRTFSTVTGRKKLRKLIIFAAMAAADEELARILTKITFRGLMTSCVITDDEYKVIKWVFWRKDKSGKTLNLLLMLQRSERREDRGSCLQEGSQHHDSVAKCWRPHRRAQWASSK